MEDEKNEIDKIKRGGCCFSNLPAHRAMRIIIKCLIIFIIFSIGVGIGSHLNYRENSGRSFKQNNFEGRGGRMMGGNRFPGVTGNCNFQRGIKPTEGDTNQIPGNTPVIKTIVAPAPIQASTTPIK